MAAVTIAGIEDAMKLRIKTASDANALGYKLRAVATYDSEFDDPARLGRAIRALPAVWVTLARAGRPKRMGADTWLCPVTMAVMVGARSVRNLAAARRGDGVEVGAYRMLDDMWTLFVGYDLGLAVRAFTPGATETVVRASLAGEGVAVLGLELDTAYARTGKLAAEAAAAPDLLKIGVNYYLKPGDDVADATDLVALRSEAASTEESK